MSPDSRVLRRIAGTLIAADVLAHRPLADGFPLWLPFGTRIAERVTDAFLQSLAASTPYLELEGMPLVPCDDYQAVMSTSFDYQNMYVLAWNGARHVVRPDNLVVAAAALARDPVHLPVVMAGACYRAETGDMKPLVRDHQMWCAVQTVHWLPDDRWQEGCALYMRVLDGFFRKLGVPVLTAEVDGIRQYSHAGYFTYAFPSSAEISLTSSLFSLAPPLVERLQLRGSVLDIGFTGKVFAVAAATHSDDVGLNLTSDIAPDMVIVGSRTPGDRPAAVAIASELTAASIRATTDDGPWHRTLRQGWRRGTPVLILADRDGGHKLLRRLGQSSEPLPAGITAAVADALREHDRTLWERAVAKRDAALAAQQVAIVAETAPPEWFPLGRPVTITGDAMTMSAERRLYARRKRLY